ncbi:hypothetical protein MRY87_03140 [bacterium]|nr:hypothetical protein [bacterium]
MTVPSSALFFSLVGGVFLTASVWRRAEREASPVLVALVRWGWSGALCSAVMLALRTVRQGGIFALPETEIFFREEWGYFFRYGEAVVYLYFLLPNYLVLRWLVRPDPKKEKYWQLMKYVCTFGRTEWGWSGAEEDRARAGTAGRALLVKCFFAPLLVSWSIGNFFFLHELSVEWSLDGAFLHRLLFHLIITVDVMIFTGGYLTELPQLKNSIRSVEPTILGWAVCLVCYPPFNEIFFPFFDIESPFDLLFSHEGLPTFVRNGVLGGILLLWGIYLWASLALGWKASNLTHRGIICHGPYRYLRHPAYTSKLLIWYLQAIFFGSFTVLLVGVFTVVYGLRIWTEERHLSRDPEYRSYCLRVPRRVLPSLSR